MGDYLDGVCNSYLEVDLAAFGRNVSRVRAHIGEDVDIMPVLKGNAYGGGLTQMARVLYMSHGVKILACAQVFEALQMREAGVECEILVMGGVPFNNIAAAVRLGLMTPAYSAEYLRLLNTEAGRQGKKARVHIKIETGLGRIGAEPGDELDALCAELKRLKNLEVVGAFTHFAQSAAVDKSFTHLQMERFWRGMEQVRAHGFDLKYVHALNTAAVSWLREPGLTHVRAAGLFFGYDDCLEPHNALGLEEVFSWRAFVTNVKTVRAGDTVGYNRHFTAQKDTRVATVSVGYGDGYARHLAMKCGAEMLVRGRRASVIGFCMDQAFLCVDGIDAAMNDTVTLLGRDGQEFISAFELQQKMDQTYLAIVATIAGRVRRVYTGAVVP